MALELEDDFILLLIENVLLLKSGMLLVHCFDRKSSVYGYCYLPQIKAKASCHAYRIQSVTSSEDTKVFTPNKNSAQHQQSSKI